jgi:putative ABC transport system substrate-binding protein
LAAKAATATIPIVTGAVSDAVVSELFASLARPGGNVTGFIGLSTAAWSKRLALAKELLPGLSRVGYLTLVGSPSAAASLQIVAEAGKALKVSAELIEFTDPGAGLATAFKDRSVDAVLVATGDAFRQRIAEVAAFMAGRALPAIYGSRDAVEAGGLMSYGTDYDDLFRRAAEYADRILRGEKPGDLPAQQAERFELVINLKTAKALGLAILPTLLARADEVIE